MKRKLALGLTAAAGAALMVAGSALPAYAGEWAWGSKNCAPSSQYVYTGSGGSGNVTHAHKISGSYSTVTFANGTVNQTRAKTFWVGMTEGASVAGASASWGTYYCG
ncbi:hypothetical protein [Leifsonia sp. Root4]|uniref:hypothetical protein n=1 Tax=Leifsonia sp. Root4 TaxID=1736525 RepID=UPI000AFF3C91|nr:hypothetical protein [Leifsonia sp. Root4]